MSTDNVFDREWCIKIASIGLAVFLVGGLVWYRQATMREFLLTGILIAILIVGSVRPIRESLSYQATVFGFCLALAFGGVYFNIGVSPIATSIFSFLIAAGIAADRLCRHYTNTQIIRWW